MRIEDILKKLKEKEITGVVIVAANEGYSVIPMSKKTYWTTFLMQKHYNGETIKDALIKLLNKED